GRVVEVVLDELPGVLVRLRGGFRPVHGPKHTKLNRRRDDDRRQVVFPAPAHAAALSGKRLFRGYLPRVRGTEGRAADGICVRVLSAFATFVLLSACPALAQASSDPGIGAGTHLGFSRARDADSGFFSGGLQVRARLT